MKLRFGTPEHGWLPTMFEVESLSLAFDASDVPCDFPSQLIAALSGVLTTPGEHTATLFEEPTEHDWRFRSSDSSAASFEIARYPDGRRARGTGEVVVSVSSSPLGLALPLWRGLRELANRARTEAFPSHEYELFPFEALDRLTERIEHARTTPP